MSDAAESKLREPILQRLARLGIKPGPAGPKTFRSRRRRLDQDENIFSKRSTTDTNKTK